MRLNTDSRPEGAHVTQWGARLSRERFLLGGFGAPSHQKVRGWSEKREVWTVSIVLIGSPRQDMSDNAWFDEDAPLAWGLNMHQMKCTAPASFGHQLYDIHIGRTYREAQPHDGEWSCVPCGLAAPYF